MADETYSVWIQIEHDPGDGRDPQNYGEPMRIHMSGNLGNAAKIMREVALQSQSRGWFHDISLPDVAALGRMIQESEEMAEHDRQRDEPSTDEGT